MKFNLLSCVSVAAVAVAVGFPAFGAEATPARQPAVALGTKSVTVFMVLSSDQPLPSGMSKKVAELVGLFLECGGMKEIEIAEAQFTPPPKADLATIAQNLRQVRAIAARWHRVRTVRPVHRVTGKRRHRDPPRRGRSARECRAD